jgi:hypothetical protein
MTSSDKDGNAMDKYWTSTSTSVYPTWTPTYTHLIKGISTKEETR